MMWFLVVHTFAHRTEQSGFVTNGKPFVFSKFYAGDTKKQKEVLFGIHLGCKHLTFRTPVALRP